MILPQFIHDMILQNTPSTLSYDYIVTTRLDNDDALHRDYIKTLQSRILEDKKEAMYNFLYGFQLVANSGVVQKYYYPNNHFTSLVEHKDKVFLSAFYGDHRYAYVIHDVINIAGKPMWCELLHDKNVANTLVISYKNSFILGYLRFHALDFGYRAIRLNFVKSVKFVFKLDTILSLLRSVKHGMLGL